MTYRARCDNWATFPRAEFGVCQILSCGRCTVTLDSKLVYELALSHCVLKSVIACSRVAE